MRGVQLAARPHALAFVSAACSLLSCALAQTPGASPLAPLFPGFSTEAPSSDASSGTGDFGALGAFDTARSRVFIPATDGTAPPVAGVPDLGGEQGEVLCTHPVVHENSEPDVLFPLVLYLHPTHGLVFEAWIAQNDAMLRLLASRGFVVCAPTMVGSRDGEGAESPIVGGLFPGAQHTAAVIERRVYPRTLAFAARAAPQLLRLGRVENRIEPFERFKTTVLLSRRTDPSRVAFAGFSAGAALATYAADALDAVWPGATRAVVALAPTVGDFQFARSKFELAAERLRVPTMLVAGAADGMGGMAGLAALGDALARAPRVGVAVAGATHCHLYIPLGSECDALDAANDAGGLGKLGRFVTSAFLHAYLGFPEGNTRRSRTEETNRGDGAMARRRAAAIDKAWGGAEALNRAGAGAWNARVLVEPLVELGLGGHARGGRVATASYAYDPVHDAWTARVPLHVAAKARGCLTEARVVRTASDEQPPKTDAPSFLRAFLDANDADGGYPPQPIGVSVLVFPNVFPNENVTERDESRTVDLVLEWRADAFGARDPARLRDPAFGGRRLLGGAGDPKADGAYREIDREIDRETSEVFPRRVRSITSDVFVDGEVAWPPSDPMAETMVRAFGLEFETPETKTNDSTVLKPVLKPSETLRVRALDACDGGTAAFLTLEVAPPRLVRTHRMMSFDESDDYAVGAFGANPANPEPVSSPETDSGSETVASATSREDALVRETASRWDAFSG